MRFLAILLLAAPLAVAAAQVSRSPSAPLTVSLDRDDWTYRTGDTARVLVQLSPAAPGARAIVTIGPERLKAIRVDTVDLSTGTARLAVTSGIPGFLRVSVALSGGSAAEAVLVTPGFTPDQLRGSVTMPADFQQFWAKAIADARRTPLEPVMARLPQYSTPEVDAYHVSFQNHRVGSRLYGMLSVPTKPGKYPATLVVPGAGVRPYFPNVSLAKRGVIHLTIGIHGIPVDRDSLLYNELRATALQAYYNYGVEDRDLYYYKRVFVGVVRAGDFIASLPQFDGENYVVQGGSQGGGLSLVAAALDPRVKGIAVTHPAMADQFAYLYGRPGGWPHIFQDTTRMRGMAEKKETLRYYDAVNFARLVKVPGFYTWGYNDNTVVPTSSWVAYNEITSPKEKLINPPGVHSTTPEQRERTLAWVLRALNVAP